MTDEMVQNDQSVDKELEGVSVPSILNINGKRVDTSKAQPLTLGDQRRLKKKGANLRDLPKTGDPDVMAELLYVFVSKMEPDITMEDIDSITNSQLKILSKLLRQVDQGPVDRPI